MVLDTEPTHDVTVAVGGHAGTDVSLSASTLTFTPSNWHIVVHARDRHRRPA